MVRPARERRSYRRSSVSFPVVLHTADGAEYQAEARDVSYGGMYVRGDFLLPPCSRCRVSAAHLRDVPGLEATVIRIRDHGGVFGMGLWFDGTAEASRLAVNKAFDAA